MEVYASIEEVIEKISKISGQRVFFDDSRMWALGYKDADGNYFGVQRPYLGGGVRGSIRSNIEDVDLRKAFTDALLEIESIINEGCEDLPSWEQNTGVLL